MYTNHTYSIIYKDNIQINRSITKKFKNDKSAISYIKGMSRKGCYIYKLTNLSADIDIFTSIDDCRIPNHVFLNTDREPIGIEAAVRYIDIRGKLVKYDKLFDSMKHLKNYISFMKKKKELKQFSVSFDRRYEQVNNEMMIRSLSVDPLVEPIPLKGFIGIKAKISFVHNGVERSLIKSFNDSDKLSNYIKYMETKSDVNNFKITNIN